VPRTQRIEGTFSSSTSCGVTPARADFDPSARPRSGENRRSVWSNCHYDRRARQVAEKASNLKSQVTRLKSEPPESGQILDS
jgi:hypothetical protein